MSKLQETIDEIVNEKNQVLVSPKTLMEEYLDNNAVYPVPDDEPESTTEKFDNERFVQTVGKVVDLASISDDEIKIIEAFHEANVRRDGPPEPLTMGEKGQPWPLTEGAKFDDGKVRMELIPPELMTAVGTILTFGAQKYEDRNWEKGMAWSRVYGALMRHLCAWWGGEEIDPETGKSHLWHAACCIAFLIAYEMRGSGTDDRFKEAA